VRALFQRAAPPAGSHTLSGASGGAQQTLQNFTSSAGEADVQLPEMWSDHLTRGTECLHNRAPLGVPEEQDTTIRLAMMVAKRASSLLGAHLGTV
jgi:hypothetical protein